MRIVELQYMRIIDVLKKELIIAMLLFGYSSPDISTCENIELSCKLLSIDEQNILSLLDSEEKIEKRQYGKTRFQFLLICPFILWVSLKPSISLPCI